MSASPAWIILNNCVASAMIVASFALSFVEARPANTTVESTPMMEIVTKSSIRVNPCIFEFIEICQIFYQIFQYNLRCGCLLIGGKIVVVLFSL